MHLIQTFELDPEEESKAAFWREIQELAREVARFEATVNEFCEAARAFKANL
jgi:hypothetical protein